MTDWGVDVSNWNAVSSWQAAKAAGVEFGLAKATEGLDYRDPTFRDNWAGMAAAGLAGRGAYHFGHPRNDPVAEAEHFLSVVGPLGPTDWWMLDAETTDGLGFGHTADWSSVFCGHVADRTGAPQRGFFYSYLSFIRSMGAAANQLTRWLLAIADYTPDPPPTAPWPTYTIWQRADNGHVAGISGLVDIDVLGPGAKSIFAPTGPPVSPGGIVLAKPASAIALTPSGQGYWIAAQDGGVFAEGDAVEYGSLPGDHVVPNAPIVGIAATPTAGYWLVGADGGIFCFGDAQMFGGLGGSHLNAPIVGMVAAHDGRGYALVASDGGVFAFGDVPFKGSVAR